jgi:hypothetical protein
VPFNGLFFGTCQTCSFVGYVFNVFTSVSFSSLSNDREHTSDFIFTKHFFIFYTN